MRMKAEGGSEVRTGRWEVRTGRWELEVDGMDNANAAFKRTFNSHSTSNPKKKEKSGGGGGI